MVQQTSTQREVSNHKGAGLRSPVLLTGATGFVGRHLYPALVTAGYDVVCASRNPAKAEQLYPGRRWVRLDVEQAETVRPALEGCRSLFYLIHGMSSGGDYEQKERAAAERLVEVAHVCGVERIVYLGGVLPKGQLSKHLRSRMQTGEILRKGPVSTVELRAGMIIGSGSESWNIVRDLAFRLPLMILPRWLSSRLEPIAIDDVIVALLFALELPDEEAGCYGIPGPEALTGEQILMRVARLHGMHPFTIKVPVLTPRLSSYWLKLITRANFRVAQELVEGMTSDLLASGPMLWEKMPDYTRISFDEAALRAFKREPNAAISTRVLEWIIHKVSPKSKAHPTRP